MSKLISSTLFFFVSLLLLLSSCNDKGKTFRVHGEISSAENKTLYLEHRGLGGIKLLDSVQVQKNGKFNFKEKAPANPEFYQLRIDNQKIIFAVDSVDNLHIKADATDLYNSYTIEPSELNEQIKKVMDMQHKAETQITELRKEHESKFIDDEAFLEVLDSVLSEYKINAANLILGNPSSAAAYYAVFQRIDDYLIFDPYDRKDYSMFGAVATSWNRYYPGTQRTKHLYEFTLNAMRERKQQNKQNEFISNLDVTESSLPDIALSDAKGNIINVTSFKGYYVLLDFTVYKADFSLKHNAMLDKIYNQYKSKGLVIYQISFDSDAHFWKNAAMELPWNTVRDSQSVNSNLLRYYNVSELPTAYILNKEGELIKRIDNFDLLEKEIAQIL